MSSLTTDSFFNTPCHRCGKPSGGSFLNNAPTCAWCLAELQSKTPYFQAPNVHVDAYLEQVGPPHSSLYEILKVRYLVEGLEPLQYIGKGVSDWVDLRAAEDIIYTQSQFILVPLGIAVELPKGYEAITAPRSSTFRKYGLIQTNSIGVIDESYCGDNDQWLWPALAMRDGHIKKNDRIAQFRIIKHQPKLVFQTSESLGNEDRSGFGSTEHK